MFSCVHASLYKTKILFVMGICIIFNGIEYYEARGEQKSFTLERGEGLQTEHASVQSHPGQYRFRLNVASPSEKSG